MLLKGKAMREYLECGKIVGAHGVYGAMRVECYCDSPAVLAKLPAVYLLQPDGSYLPRKVLKGAVKPPQALLTIEGVESPEQVMPLRGTLLYAHRADIPLKKGAYFIVDLLWLPVLDADTGVRYGELLSVDDSPASRLYTVRTDSGRDVLLPAVSEFVKVIRIGECIRIRPIPGFFDEV